jgi:hypothetical protein
MLAHPKLTAPILINPSGPTKDGPRQSIPPRHFSLIPGQSSPRLLNLPCGCHNAIHVRRIA